MKYQIHNQIYDFIFIHLETKSILCKKKERYAIKTTLKNPIIDTCNKFMNDSKCNDVLPFLETITIKCLLNKIKSILVNDFEFLPFYNDKLISLSELNSRSSNIAGGYPIDIYF